MIIDQFVCVFAAWIANAPINEPTEYLALMEATATEGEYIRPIQSSPNRWLVDHYVDQDGQPIVPSEHQFITDAETLKMRIEAGENVLSKEFIPNAYSTLESTEAQLAERLKAVDEIEKAEAGQNAQFCEFNAM